MARAAIVVKGREVSGDQPISPSFKFQPTRKIGAKIYCALEATEEETT
jgi:hypothetical protein